MSYGSASEEARKKYEKEFSDFLIEKINNAGGSLQFQYLYGGLLQELRFDIRDAFGRTKFEVMKFLRGHPKTFNIDSKGIVTLKVCSVSENDDNIDDKKDKKNIERKKILSTKIVNGNGIVQSISATFGIIKALQPVETFIYFTASDFGAAKDSLLIDLNLEIGVEVCFNAVLGLNEYEIEYRATKVWRKYDSDDESPCFVNRINEKKVYCERTSVKKEKKDKTSPSNSNLVEVVMESKVQHQEPSPHWDTNKNDVTTSKKRIENQAGKIYPFRDGSIIKFEKGFHEQADGKSCDYFMYGSEVFDIDWEFSEGDDVFFDAIRTERGWRAVLVWIGDKPVSKSSNKNYNSHEETNEIHKPSYTSPLNSLSKSCNPSLKSTTMKCGPFNKDYLLRKKDNDAFEPSAHNIRSKKMFKQEKSEYDRRNSSMKCRIWKSKSELLNEDHLPKKKDNAFQLSAHNIGSKQTFKQENSESDSCNSSVKSRTRKSKSDYLNKEHIMKEKDKKINYSASNKKLNTKYRQENSEISHRSFEELPYIKSKTTKLTGSKRENGVNQYKYTRQNLLSRSSEVSKLDSDNDSDFMILPGRHTSHTVTTESDNDSSEDNNELQTTSIKRKFLRGNEYEHSSDMKEITRDEINSENERHEAKSRNFAKNIKGNACIEKLNNLNGEITHLYCKYAMVKSSHLQNEHNFMLDVFFVNGKSVEEQEVYDLKEVISVGDNVQFNFFKIVDDEGEIYHKITMAWRGLKPDVMEITPEEFIRDNQLSVSIICQSDDEPIVKDETTHSFLSVVNTSDSDDKLEFYSAQSSSMNEIYEDSSNASDDNAMESPSESKIGINKKGCKDSLSSVDHKLLSEKIIQQLKKNKFTLSYSEVDINIMVDDIINSILEKYQSNVRTSSQMVQSAYLTTTAAVPCSAYAEKNKSCRSKKTTDVEVQTIITGDIVASSIYA